MQQGVSLLVRFRLASQILRRLHEHLAHHEVPTPNTPAKPTASAATTKSQRFIDQNEYDAPNSTKRGGMIAVGLRKLAPDCRIRVVTVFTFSAL